MSIEVKKNFQTFLDSNVFRPGNEKNVSEIVRDNYKKNLPLEIIGSNSKKFIGYNMLDDNKPDILPTHVLFGLTDGKIFFFPNCLPIIKANESVIQTAKNIININL